MTIAYSGIVLAPWLCAPAFPRVYSEQRWTGRAVRGAMSRITATGAKFGPPRSSKRTALL